MKISILKTIRTLISNTSIHMKLLFSFFILILIPLLILSTLTYIKVSNTMEETILRTSRNTLSQSVSILEAKLSVIMNSTNIISFNKTLYDVITAKQDVYDNDLLKQSVDQKNLSNLIQQIERSSDIYRVRLYIRNIPGFFYDNINFNIYDDLKSLSWYKKLESMAPVINMLAPQHFETEDNQVGKIIVVLLRVNFIRYDIPDALIRIDLHESVINNIVSQANNSKTGLSYIVNHDGEIISSSGNLRLLENMELRKSVENNAPMNDMSRNITVGNNSFLTIQKDVAQSDWKFITIIPYHEIKSTGQNIRFYMMIVMLITGVFSYIIAWFIASTSTKRLRNLANSMKIVTGGNFNVNISETSNDEIGQLTHDFNFMVKEMSDMIDERYETGKRIKSLELKSLQSQINPHFLYNSLDMINWSAAVTGNDKIVEMVQSLSIFYKIGLSKGMDIISIKNEIEHVKAYVNIQNLRFSNQITLEIDVDEEVYSYGILKITLQPFVENAIHHGILKKAEKSGIIRISAKRINDNIVFKIQDNGIGMSEDIVESLPNKDTFDEFHGFGIKNINERIKLQFGQQYGIHFDSTPGVGTTVTITIPSVCI